MKVFVADKFEQSGIDGLKAAGSGGLLSLVVRAGG
jgi:hypothetical protein